MFINVGKLDFSISQFSLTLKIQILTEIVFFFSLKVTRGSLRRMASMESLTDLESRPDTPTVPLRTTKKLQTITENGESCKIIFSNDFKYKFCFSHNAVEECQLAV